MPQASVMAETVFTGFIGPLRTEGNGLYILRGALREPADPPQKNASWKRNGQRATPGGDSPPARLPRCRESRAASWRRRSGQGPRAFR